MKLNTKMRKYKLVKSKKGNGSLLFNNTNYVLYRSLLEELFDC